MEKEKVVIKVEWEDREFEIEVIDLDSEEEVDIKIEREEVDIKIEREEEEEVEDIHLEGEEVDIKMEMEEEEEEEVEVDAVTIKVEREEEDEEDDCCPVLEEETYIKMEWDDCNPLPEMPVLEPEIEDVMVEIGGGGDPVYEGVVASLTSMPPIVRRGRGRPKGSKGAKGSKGGGRSGGTGRPVGRPKGAKGHVLKLENVLDLVKKPKPSSPPRMISAPPTSQQKKNLMYGWRSTDEAHWSIDRKVYGKKLENLKIDLEEEEERDDDIVFLLHKRKRGRPRKVVVKKEPVEKLNNENGPGPSDGEEAAPVAAPPIAESLVAESPVAEPPAVPEPVADQSPVKTCDRVEEPQQQAQQGQQEAQQGQQEVIEPEVIPEPEVIVIEPEPEVIVIEPEPEVIVIEPEPEVIAPQDVPIIGTFTEDVFDGAYYLMKFRMGWCHKVSRV